MSSKPIQVPYLEKDRKQFYREKSRQLLREINGLHKRKRELTTKISELQEELSMVEEVILDKKEEHLLFEEPDSGAYEVKKPEYKRVKILKEVEKDTGSSQKWIEKKKKQKKKGSLAASLFESESVEDNSRESKPQTQSIVEVEDEIPLTQEEYWSPIRISDEEL